jgi:glyoxylase-like metal-dependent hydrolase (beta-lactamase superfamily II)
MESIYTPGHLDDHMSFLIKDETEQILISGDIILGTPSALVQDLDVYLKTLRKLQDFKIDYILLPHSTSLDPTDVLVPA